MSAPWAQRLDRYGVAMVLSTINGGRDGRPPETAGVQQVDLLELEMVSAKNALVLGQPPLAECDRRIVDG